MPSKTSEAAGVNTATLRRLKKVQPASTAVIGPEVAAHSTRERIFTAAIHLFAKKGFGSVGIREIALEANISTAVLYYHVESKRDLLFQLMSDRLGRITTLARQACTRLDRPEERLVALVRMHVLAHALHPDEVVDDELPSLGADERRFVVTLRDEYESLWAAVLADGRSSPAVFQVRDEKLTRLALLEMCNGVARWYSPTGELSAQEIADHYARLALTMTAASRKRRLLRLEDVAGPSVKDCARLVEGGYGV